MMLWLRRLSACGFVLALLAGAPLPATASDSSFPFGSALVLEAPPLPGSKRMPMVEIEDNGAATFYLWCASARGSANVAADTISLVPTTALPSQCTADQISRDADLLAQLAQVTAWRRQGDEIDFLGATMLRFRLMTN
jgi:META domain